MVKVVSPCRHNLVIALEPKLQLLVFLNHQEILRCTLIALKVENVALPLKLTFVIFIKTLKLLFVCNFSLDFNNLMRDCNREEVALMPRQFFIPTMEEANSTLDSKNEYVLEHAVHIVKLISSLALQSWIYESLNQKEMKSVRKFLIVKNLSFKLRLSPSKKIFLFASMNSL